MRSKLNRGKIIGSIKTKETLKSPFEILWGKTHPLKFYDTL